VPRWGTIRFERLRRMNELNVPTRSAARGSGVVWAMRRSYPRGTFE